MFVQIDQLPPWYLLIPYESHPLINGPWVRFPMHFGSKIDKDEKANNDPQQSFLSLLQKNGDMTERDAQVQQITRVR